jgi:hypothetical protein
MIFFKEIPLNTLHESKFAGMKNEAIGNKMRICSQILELVQVFD